MKNRRAKELQKWQRGVPARLREGVREAFAKEHTGAERVPSIDVPAKPPQPTVEGHPELLRAAVMNAKFLLSKG